MAKAFDQLTKDWSAERLARVEVRAKQLIAEEMRLRDLRKARAPKTRRGRKKGKTTESRTRG
jgi:hypothetical protein